LLFDYPVKNGGWIQSITQVIRQAKHKVTDYHQTVMEGKKVDKSKCKHCFEEVITGAENTNNNLFCHLTNKHLLVYKTLQVNWTVKKPCIEGEGTISPP